MTKPAPRSDRLGFELERKPWIDRLDQAHFIALVVVAVILAVALVVAVFV